MPAWKITVLCLALGSLPVALWAKPPALDSSKVAREWLEKMSRAKHDLNYEGVFVYLTENGQMMSMRISHRAGPQGEQERLVSLNGSEREVVHESQVLTCILPNKSLTRISTGKQEELFPNNLPADDVAELDRHYGFTLAGQGRIAGRPVQKILVKPKDVYRYGYQLWLDSSSGLLLKSDLINEFGDLVEQVMFTSIDVQQPIPPSDTGADTAPCPRDVAQKELRHASALAADKAWQLDSLPQGYKVARYSKRTMLNQRIPVEHLIVTDGLASVSVYVERLGVGDKFIGASRMGSVNAFGVVLNGYQITAVGVVPPPTVQVIAQSIRRIQP